MTIDEANVLRTILAKRVVPRDAEEGMALMQLADKVFSFVAQNQPKLSAVPAPLPAPAAQVADTNGK